MKWVCLTIMTLVLYPSIGQTSFQTIPLENADDYSVTSPVYGSGASAMDFDQDGDTDIYFSNDASTPDFIYVNQGNLEFEKLEFDIPLDTRAALWFDYNGDHYLDLLVIGDCYVSSSPCNNSNNWVLYKQDESGFTDVTFEAGLDSVVEFSDGVAGGVASGDLNLDGYLDLVITFWRGERYIFLNNGNGSFELNEDWQTGNFDFYWQPIIYDLNKDHWPDVYMPIDFDYPNQFFSHEGDFQFKDIAPQLGLDNEMDDMGVAIGDVDNDQDMDIYVTCIDIGLKQNELFIMENGSFSRGAIEANVHEGGWAWGCTFIQLDNDHFVDLAVTNGLRTDIDQSKVWQNQGNLNFQDVSVDVSITDTYMATTFVSADLDRDGDQDLIQTIKSNQHPDVQPYFIHENILQLSEGANYLVIQPRMRGTNYWAIGSMVKVHIDETVLTVPITSGTSFYGQEPAEAFFGLGDANFVDKVEVIWPGGGSTILENVAANQVLNVSDDGALHPPSKLSVELSSNDATEVTWEKMSEVETGFILEKSRDPDFEEPTIIELSSETTSYSDTGLEPSSVYYYRVKAKNGDLESMYSLVVSVATGLIELSSPQDFLVTEATEEFLRLEWVDTEEFETGFELQRSTDPSFANYLTFSLEANAIQFIDSTLEPGVEYYYRLRAFNGYGISSFSEVASGQLLEKSVTLSVESREFEIYPNPAKSVIVFNSGSREISEIRLFDLDGRVIHTWSVNSHNFQAEVSEEPGVYVAVIDLGNRKVVRKIKID